MNFMCGSAPNRDKYNIIIVNNKYSSDVLKKPDLAYNYALKRLLQAYQIYTLQAYKYKYIFINICIYMNIYKYMYIFININIYIIGLPYIYI